MIRTGAKDAVTKPVKPTVATKPRKDMAEMEIDGEYVRGGTDPFDSPSYADMPAYVAPPLETSLQVLDEIEQGTDAWHDQRRGIVTASVVHLLVTATLKVANNDSSRGLTALLAAERITGFTEPSPTSHDMMRGILDEPYAREIYSEHHAPVTETGFMVREGYGFKIGFSPDGLVNDDGLIEIKSRVQKKHLQTILADAVPSENMAQIQTGLLVSGRDWCDYVSYCGGMPLWTKRVYPDHLWHDTIIDAIGQLETNAAAMIAAYTKSVEGCPPTERIEHFADMEID